MRDQLKKAMKATLALVLATTVISGNVSAAVDGAGWDTEYDFYGTRLNWTRDRFKNHTTYWGSTGGMNFFNSTDQSLTNGVTSNYRQGDNGYALTNDATPTFRWGYYNLQKGDTTFNWIQYSQGFSDIEIDLGKDFALGGTMTIGSDFGLLDEYSEGATKNYAGLGGTGLRADGGLTISLIPTTYRDEIIKNAGNGLSGVQRLGAYGVFKNSIIMEFDVGHQNGYASITGNKKASFYLAEPQKELKRVGDWTISKDDLKALGLNDYQNTFYDKNKFPSVASQSHIGISVTGDNGYVNSQSDSSDRRFIWGGDTGAFDYKIEYRAKSGQMFYSVRHTKTGTWEYVTQYTIPQNYRNKRYTVATSFSAIYQHYDRFSGTGGFFNGATNANANSGAIAPGQMELTIEGVYSQPDLRNLENGVHFMKDPAGFVGVDDNAVQAYKEGYPSGSGNQETKRSFFPLEGDRIVLHNQADVSAMFNENSQASGTLTLTNLNFRDLKFTDVNGNAISGIPPGLDAASVNNMNVKYYYSVDGGTNWIPCQKSNKLNETIASDRDQPLRWRVALTLPETTDPTDQTNRQFWLSGEVVVTVSRDGSTATFNLPLYKENGGRVTFFSDPKDVGANGISKSNARVIPTSANIQTLSATKTGADESALAYGVKVWYNAAQKEEAYDPSYDSQEQTYSYKDIDAILANAEATQVATPNQDLTLQKDTRYIVTYTLYDSKFNTNANIASMAKNAERAKSETTRVIWNSDNVKSESGYEFYMEPSVEMTLEELDGFLEASQRGAYYRKIAEKANVAVFKTANADWTNLANATTISGNGDHAQLTAAIRDPGTAYDVPIQFKQGDATIEKTVKVTVKNNVPKVVSDTADASIGNQTATKVIFDREDYTIHATFRLVSDDGTALDLEEFDWNEIKGEIQAALYKKNGAQASGSKDAFYRWANLTQADNNALASNGSNVKKLELPAELTYNGDGTFTVTYTLLNNSAQAESANWVQSTWEDGAQWRIYAWTAANESTHAYGNIADTATDQLSLDAKDDKVPSVTTSIQVIEKDNGHIPDSMFVISDVRLAEDADHQLVNKDPHTTISVARIEGANEDAMHDYYYEVKVSDSAPQTSGQVYSLLKQASSGKTIQAMYLRYLPSTQGYERVTSSDRSIGKISYNRVQVGNETITNSIRFGMEAIKPEGLHHKDAFSGKTAFTFTRQAIGGDGS